jgi:hypothetical protein
LAGSELRTGAGAPHSFLHIQTFGHLHPDYARPEWNAEYVA